MPVTHEVLRTGGKSQFLLLCDHASRAVPADYANLGLDEALLWRHIAWDIGAADMTRRLSELLDAPAILGCVSRLVVDLNRAPDDPGLIPPLSDGVAIPGNAALDAAARAKRVARWHRPYHDAVRAAIAAMAQTGRCPHIIAMHSFTPIMGSFERPWHVGVLWAEGAMIAADMLTSFRRNRSLVVGDNQPYSAIEPYSYTMMQHGADNGLPFVGLEIRQDLIDTRHGAEAWANIVADALRRLPVLDVKEAR